MKRQLESLIILISVMSCLFITIPVNGSETLETKNNVAIEEIKHSSGIPGLRATFTVNASRDDIWNVLVDYDNFQKIFDGIDKIKVVSQDGTGAIVEFWIDAVIIDLNYVLRREYAEVGKRISWKRISGDLDEITGSWVISNGDKPDSYFVEYESYIDVGNFVITWIARLIAKRKARAMAVKLKSWIENLDHSSNQ